MDISERIAYLREKRGLSQAQLGEKLNVSTSTIGMWETGKRGLKEESIKQLADYFDVSADYLLDIENKDIPDWASTDDLLKLEDMLASNKPMAYNGIELNEEDKERINAVLTQVFWERLKKQKDKKQ